MPRIFSFIFISLFLLQPYSSLGQNDGQTIVEKNKLTRNILKIPDTIGIKGLLHSKIDTLYFRNLNPPIAEKKESYFRDVLTLIGVIIGALLGWLSQFLLKKQEKNVNSHNLKEAKRIQHIEALSSQINELSLCDPNNSLHILALLENLRNYIFTNNLYINKKYEDLVETICDYHNEVAADFRNKNLTKEFDFSRQFKKLFNK